MVRAGLLTSLLVAASFHAAAASDRAAEPSPNLLFQLEKQNRSHPWFLATTDSARLRLKVRRIDERGLRGLTVPEGASTPPGLLPWSKIDRLDEVVTRAQRGRVWGAIAIGLAGAGLGNMIGAADHRGGQLAMAGLAVFGGLGAWGGGWYGERFQHERNWYVADPRRALGGPLAAAAAADSGPVGVTPENDERGSTTVAESAASPAAIRAAERIGSDDVIRATGDFGRFQGFAHLAGPQGLEGLRVDRRARGEWTRAVPSEPIAWNTIDEVRMRGGNGMTGALVGAAVFAAAGALLGVAVVAASSTTDATVGEGAAVGAAISAPVGAVLGLASGALVRRWVVVYRRR